MVLLFGTFLCVSKHFRLLSQVFKTKVLYGPRRNDAGVLREHDHDAGEFQRLPNRIRRPRDVKSRIGSLDNVHHKAGGGTREIFT